MTSAFALLRFILLVDSMQRLVAAARPVAGSQGDQGLNLCTFSAFSHGFSPDPVGRAWPKSDLSSKEKSDSGTPLVCKRVPN